MAGSFQNFEKLNYKFGRIPDDGANTEIPWRGWFSAQGFFNADFWAEFSPIFQPAPIRAMIRPGAMGLN